MQRRRREEEGLILAFSSQGGRQVPNSKFCQKEFEISIKIHVQSSLERLLKHSLQLIIKILNINLKSYSK